MILVIFCYGFSMYFFKIFMIYFLRKLYTMDVELIQLTNFLFNKLLKIKNGTSRQKLWFWEGSSFFLHYWTVLFSHVCLCLSSTIDHHYQQLSYSARKSKPRLTIGGWGRKNFLLKIHITPSEHGSTLG